MEQSYETAIQRRGQASVVVLDTPKVPVVLYASWRTVFSWAGGPVGLIFPAASMLGLCTPSTTCLCCHQSLFGSFFSWRTYCKRSFYLVERKCLNRSFLYPYDTFNLATLEVWSVGAARLGSCGRGSQKFASSSWDLSGLALWRPLNCIPCWRWVLCGCGCCVCRGQPVHGMAMPWSEQGCDALGRHWFILIK